MASNCTVSLVVLALSLALSVDVAVPALTVLLEALLATILRIISLLAAIVALLVLRHAIAAGSVGLAWGESSSAGLEGRGAGAEGGLSLLALVVAQVHLLGLLGQVLVLGRRVILPGVEVRHVGWLLVGCRNASMGREVQVENDAGKFFSRGANRGWSQQQSVGWTVGISRTDLDSHSTVDGRDQTKADGWARENLCPKQ